MSKKIVTCIGGLICAATITLQIMSPIGISTDYYRYIWQGRISNAGQNNYSLKPWDPGVDRANNELFDRMDWKDVRSVYPPLAEQYFRVHASIFDSSLLANYSFNARLAFSKLPNLMLYIVCAFLLYALTSRKLYAFVWLVFPVTQFELLNSAHIDILSITLILGALYALKSSTVYLHALAGALIASAGMVKLAPFALILPIAVYLYSRFGPKHVYALIGAYASVIAVTVSPFLMNDFSLVKRMHFWFGGNEFHSGNPLYEALTLFSLPTGLLKIVTVGLGLFIAYLLLSLAKNKAFDYSKMLYYSILMVTLPYIASPVVLPWYWLTPCVLMCVYVATNKRIISNMERFYTALAFVFLMIQYIEGSSATPEQIQVIVAGASSFVFYAIVARQLLLNRDD